MLEQGKIIGFLQGRLEFGCSGLELSALLGRLSLGPQLLAQVQRTPVKHRPLGHHGKQRHQPHHVGHRFQRQLEFRLAFVGDRQVRDHAAGERFENRALRLRHGMRVVLHVRREIEQRRFAGGDHRRVLSVA